MQYLSEKEHPALLSAYLKTHTLLEAKFDFTGSQSPTSHKADKRTLNLQDSEGQLTDTISSDEESDRAEKATKSATPPLFQDNLVKNKLTNCVFPEMRRKSVWFKTPLPHFIVRLRIPQRSV